MTEIETLAKTLFTKWQVLPREKAIVWEDLAREPTGKLNDGFTLRYNFMRQAYILVGLSRVQAGEIDWGISYKDENGDFRYLIVDSGGQRKDFAEQFAETLKGVDERYTDIKLVARELGLPHANTGR